VGIARLRLNRVDLDWFSKFFGTSFYDYLEYFILDTLRHPRMTHATLDTVAYPKGSLYVSGRLDSADYLLSW
jgi:hypothetical protein